MILSTKHYKQHKVLKSLLLNVKFILVGLPTLIGLKKRKLTHLPHNFISSKSRLYPSLKKFETSDDLKCVSCGLCEKICPTGCIEIDSHSVMNSQALTVGKPPRTFNIELLKCTRCNLCEEVCPVDAISLSGSYNFFEKKDKKVWKIEDIS